MRAEGKKQCDADVYRRREKEPREYKTTHLARLTTGFSRGGDEKRRVYVYIRARARARKHEMYSTRCAWGVPCCLLVVN